MYFCQRLNSVKMFQSSDENQIKWVQSHKMCYRRFIYTASKSNILIIKLHLQYSETTLNTYCKFTRKVMYNYCFLKISI